MTTPPACSPKSPWSCPPDVREQMLRTAQIDDRTRDSGAWFDEWKKTRNLQPPQSPVWNDDSTIKPLWSSKPLQQPPVNWPPRNTEPVFTSNWLRSPNDVVIKTDDVIEPLRSPNDVVKSSPIILPWAPPGDLDKAFESVEKQRQRERELFERLEQQWAMGWIVPPRLIDVPVIPLRQFFTEPPGVRQWLLFVARRRKEPVPA